MDRDSKLSKKIGQLNTFRRRDMIQRAVRDETRAAAQMQTQLGVEDDVVNRNILATFTRLKESGNAPISEEP